MFFWKNKVPRAAAARHIDLSPDLPYIVHRNVLLSELAHVQKCGHLNIEPVCEVGFKFWLFHAILSPMSLKSAAIIAEFNPFHKGHLYLMQKAREAAGDACLAVIMSGDFVQRGAPAIFDKYVRTEAALSCGADLVIELPLPYSCASSEFFASGALSIVKGLNVFSHLVFGSESGDIRKLQSAAESTLSESADFKTRIRESLASGHSYSRAYAEAYSKDLCQNDFRQADSSQADFNQTVFSQSDSCQADFNHSSFSQADFSQTDSCQASFSQADPCQADSSRTNRDQFRQEAWCNSSNRSPFYSPNDTLGIEYLRAIKRSDIPITPICIKREEKEPYASASRLREIILSHCKESPTETLQALANSGLQALSAYLPKPSIEVLIKALTLGQGPLSIDDFSKEIRYSLLEKLSDPKRTSGFFGTDLEMRIRRLLSEYRSASSFLSLLKSKNFLYTSLSRSLIHSLLNINQSQIRDLKFKGYPVYARILGFKKSSSDLVSEIMEKSQIPVIMKPSEWEKALPPVLHPIWHLGTFSNTLYGAALRDTYGTDYPNEYQRKLIVI